MNEQYETNKKLSLRTSRALISSIPVLGGVINTVIGDYVSGRKFDRLQDLHNNLSDEVSKIQHLINNEYITKVDFLDVYEETASYVVNERSEIKRKLYQNILLSSIVLEDVDFDKTEKYLRLLEDLREDHIFILKILIDPTKYDESVGNRVGQGGGMSTSLSRIFDRLIIDWSSEDVVDTINDLERYRLVKDIITSYHSTSTDQGIRLLRNKITAKGNEFIKYLKLREMV